MPASQRASRPTSQLGSNLFPSPAEDGDGSARALQPGSGYYLLPFAICHPTSTFLPPPERRPGRASRPDQGQSLTFGCLGALRNLTWRPSICVRSLGALSAHFGRLVGDRPTDRPGMVEGKVEGKRLDLGARYNFTPRQSVSLSRGASLITRSRADSAGSGPGHAQPVGHSGGQCAVSRRPSDSRRAKVGLGRPDNVRSLHGPGRLRACICACSSIRRGFAGCWRAGRLAGWLASDPGARLDFLTRERASISSRKQQQQQQEQREAKKPQASTCQLRARKCGEARGITELHALHVLISGRARPLGVTFN